MHIEILGAESLGVRGLCCFVKTEQRNILIDPGISLGYVRDKLPPHPLQIAVDERIQKKIIRAWEHASDVVISHFHGDHVPLEKANPYQLDIKKLEGLNKKIKIWTKNPRHFSPTEEYRSKSFSAFLQTDLTPSEEETSGPMAFSGAVPHGNADNNPETVMMTRIEEGEVFVHASDIQLLDDETVSALLNWEPDIVLAGGPALYLSRLSHELIERAWNNAFRLSQAVDTLILDHHLLRSHEGIQWLTQLTSRTGKPVLCAADFMGTPRLLLEADRRVLYEKLPVPSGWHEDYAEGKVTTDPFWHAAQSLALIPKF